MLQMEKPGWGCAATAVRGDAPKRVLVNVTQHSDRIGVPF